MQELQTITIKKYLIRKGIAFRESNGEIITRCLFNDCDKDSRDGEAHLYFDAETGQYDCKKCGERGNIITLAKKNTPHHQRVAFSIIPDKKIIKELFKEIGPRFQNRTGGYTRIIPLNFRKGDGASMVILELTEKKIIEKTKVKKALDKDNKAAQKKAPIQKQEPQKAKKETTAKAKADEKPEAHQIAPKPKAVVTEKIAKEKGKAEKTKIQKGFMKGLRGFFRSKNP